MKKTTCKDHTPQPSQHDPLGWHDWAGNMTLAGKVQTQCDQCGRFQIWRDGRGIVRRRMFGAFKERL